MITTRSGTSQLPHDQWEAEPSKAQAKALVEPLVAKSPAPVDDSSTQALLNWYRTQRDEA